LADLVLVIALPGVPVTPLETPRHAPRRSFSVYGRPMRLIRPALLAEVHRVQSAAGRPI
jgi:hypothetical protein